MKLLNNLFMKTFLKKRKDNIEFSIKLPTRWYITTLVSRECKDFFNMVYITDYTEKVYTVQRNFVIILIQADLLSQNLQKWIQTEKFNLKPKFTTLKLLCSSPKSLGKSATSLDSVTRE